MRAAVARWLGGPLHENEAAGAHGVVATREHEPGRPIEFEMRVPDDLALEPATLFASFRARTCPALLRGTRFGSAEAASGRAWRSGVVRWITDAR